MGYYARAETIAGIATQPSGSTLWRVLLPAFSPIQEDKARSKHAVRIFFTMVVFFHFPLMIGLLAIAEPMIILLMTERWARSIAYFRIFCIAGLIYPLLMINLSILIVTGRSALFFRLDVIKKVLVILAVVATYRFGITALIYGQIAISVAAFVINSVVSGKIIKYSPIEQLRDFTPSLIMAIGMGIIVWFVGSTIPSLLSKLLLQVGVGVIVYLIFTYFFSRSLLYELLHLISNLFKGLATTM